MPTIVRIRQVKRGSSLYFELRLSDGEVILTSDLALSTSGLRVGDEVDEQTAHELAAEGAQAKAWALAVKYVGSRMRTRQEVARHLSAKEFDGATIDEVCERLTERGLLDDLAYARAWVADRQRFKPRSRSHLRMELRGRGLSDEAIERALMELEPEAELSSLQELVQKKRRQSAYQDDAKLKAYLSRQGYSWEQIRRATADED